MILRRVALGAVLGAALIAFACARAPAAGSAAPATNGTHSTASGEEHGGAHGAAPNASPLEFKKDLALWTFVIFLVLLAVLWKFAWGPIRDGLDQRERGIANDIAEAQKQNADARAILAQYEQKLEGAKDDVRGILDEARRNADVTGRKIVEAAQGEARAEHQRALAEIDRATGDALKDLARRSADLAVQLAGKIVRAELRPDDHARLLDEAVAGFAGDEKRGEKKG
ncbi:MAG: F0F1 ATP synthase subunit B [Pirellulales bacterium]|nr:F0F1 ATP synthase subunit B [Pirellulales bacterium]